MRRDRPVVYDVSTIDDSETDLQAAVLLACWAAGFGTVNVSNALADAGLEPRRHYFVILDELWRALRAGRGMVDRVDALTRLNRQRGVGMAMISHTMSDLMSLPTEEDRMKAAGFVERSGMVICGGLPSKEMPLLNSAISMSRAEQEMLQGWQDPPAWDPITGQEADPPGRGKFLIKVGGRPGIPLTVELTDAELRINDMRDDEFDEQGTAVDSADETPEPDLFYGSVDEFVREYLIKVYRRPVGAQGGMRWAARWWEYPEALSRLDALWRAWEHLRLDPATGMSVWWRDHADHHMPALLSPNGPFAASDNQNKRGASLPYEAPPEGLFPDMRQSG